MDKTSPVPTQEGLVLWNTAEGEHKDGIHWEIFFKEERGKKEGGIRVLGLLNGICPMMDFPGGSVVKNPFAV